jgi:hypothetical protein
VEGSVHTVNENGIETKFFIFILSSIVHFFDRNASMLYPPSHPSTRPPSLPFSPLTFIEQNLGPHMEQKWAFLPASESMVSSWYARAVMGSMARLN